MPRINQEMSMGEIGDRFNAKKAKLSFLFQFPTAIKGVSIVGTFGAEKYSKNNWKKGLNHTEVVDSLMRHLSSYMDGEMVDPESGLPHVDHVSWNALALAEMVATRPELDDRGLL